MLVNFIRTVVLIFMLLVASGAGAETSDHELRLKALEEKLEAKSKGREWIDRFTFKNDLRLRHESRFLDKDASGNNVLDQHRERFRLRLSGEYNFDSNLKVGLRLASGSSDPISTNQTMNDAFGKKTINIDWAYAHYARSFGALKTQFTGGKFDEPFFRASELVWDYDLSMEGLAEGFSFPLGASTTLFATFGQMAVDESATRQYDPYLIGYQGGVEQNLGPLGKAKAAVAYYDYANVKGKVIPHRKSTNTLTGGGLANDFNIVVATATWSIDMGVPFKVLGEYVNNVADGVSSREDTAYLAGFALGNSPKKFGDWLAYYQYRVVEQDAVFDAFTHSDFHNGGTNAKGSAMGMKFGVMKGVQFDASYYVTRANRGAPVDEDRLQLDAIFKF